VRDGLALGLGKVLQQPFDIHHAHHSRRAERDPDGRL
jgi:hypothetical protein